MTTAPQRPDVAHQHPAGHSSVAKRTKSALMTAALAAASQDFYVFPLRPRSKTPRLHGRDRCDNTGACADGHLGWEQRATTAPDLIRTWWNASPDSNIGIACGPSNLYVLDLDPAHDEDPPQEWLGARHGRDVLARLAAEAGQPYPGDTYTVRSPSSSDHLYFRVDSNSTLRNTAGRAGWHVDSRGRGGFVVAAGSKRAGGSYWVVRRSPVSPLPQWLIPHFTPPPLKPAPVVYGEPRPLSNRRRQRYLDTVTEGVATAAPKTAHDTLVRAAYTLGRLVAGGEFTDAEARSALHAAAEQRHIPSCEAAAAISDGLAIGGRNPRRLSEQVP